MTKQKYDKIILGAGIFGLYAATLCGARKEKVLVMEMDSTAFARASYINQARLHLGYHYPRSPETAKLAATYFSRFAKDFQPAINKSYDSVYAVSSQSSFTTSEHFKAFCTELKIPCKPIDKRKYFQNTACEEAFLTREYAFDGKIIRDILMEKIKTMPNVSIVFNTCLKEIIFQQSDYELITSNNDRLKAEFLINTTYASINQILHKSKLSGFPLKYELCEIILCEAGSVLANTAITVMDGPFFSLMPFGNSLSHSLTTVSSTPHLISHNELPEFACQAQSNGYCSSEQLGNCNICPAKPATAWLKMQKLAASFLLPNIKLHYQKSLFAIKPVLLSSEKDDARPTIILNHNPSFLSVLSGKINTIYELDKVLGE